MQHIFSCWKICWVLAKCCKFWKAVLERCFHCYLVTNGWLRINRDGSKTGYRSYIRSTPTAIQPNNLISKENLSFSFFHLLSPEVQVRAAQSEPSSDFPVGQRNCGVFRSVSTFQWQWPCPQIWQNYKTRPQCWGRKALVKKKKSMYIFVFAWIDFFLNFLK